MASNSLQSSSVSSSHPVKGDMVNGVEDDDRPKEKEPWVFCFYTTLLWTEAVILKSVGSICHPGGAP